MRLLHFKIKHLQSYLTQVFSGKIENLKITKLGKGVLGVGYALDFELNGQPKRKILKTLFPKHMGQEYPADRAQSLILAHADYNKLDKHIGSFDVCGLGQTGQIISLGQAQEFFILMDEAKGHDYFSDLLSIAKNNRLTKADINKSKILADYLVKLHSQKHKSDTLYQRKIRDTIGSGQSIMSVLDSYSKRLVWFNQDQINQLVQLTVNYWTKDRYKFHRLSQIHGDFHPGNIWWQSNRDFILLDRARGEFGEPADDLSALTINHLFFSQIYQHGFSGALRKMFNDFFKNYLVQTQDYQILEVIQPYFVFRAVIVSHPKFYPDSFYPQPHQADNIRRSMINFALNILKTDKVNLDQIDQYLKKERC